MATLHDPGEAIAERLRACGIEARGWFAVTRDECAGTDIASGTPGLLFGNHGGALWDAFSISPESADGLPDPMDRWTARVVKEALAGEEGAVAAFPFGSTAWPFQRWAKRAMGLESSPLGLLIHPEWGLWHALRVAVLFPGLDSDIALPRKPIHPCANCIEKPCLSACPVEAFSVSGFAVARCRSYLDSRLSSSSDSSAADCNRSGCAARDACPVGRQWRYPDAEIRFHMAAFRR